MAWWIWALIAWPPVALTLSLFIGRVARVVGAGTTGEEVPAPLTVGVVAHQHPEVAAEAA